VRSATGASPHPDDRRILVVPCRPEFGGKFFGRGLSRRGINRPDIFGDLVALC
jgi:hypothetical protein